MRDYFLDGFKLLNKTLVVYIIDLFWIIISLLFSNSNELKSGINNLITGIVMLVIPLFMISYSLSVPRLLMENIDNKFSYSFLWKTYRHNIKRLILPYIILFPLLIIFFLLLFGIILLLTHNINSITDFLHRTQYVYSMEFFTLVIAMMIITSPFLFSSIYFSVENKGIISSLKNSFIFSKRNISFVFMANILYVCSILFANYITHAINIEKIIVSFATSIITIYAWTGIIAGCLLYYLGKKKKLP